MTKKILVCGAAGFLMSNLVRYTLYKTKDFKFVCVDNLSASEMKNVYVHRYAKFYLGDINDDAFMGNIIKIEKPDIIVNGANPKQTYPAVFGHKKVLDGLISLSQYNIPIIQLGWPDEVDPYGVWNLIRNIVIRDVKGTYLVIPNCFGMRQRRLFSSHIRGIIEAGKAYVRDEKWPWVYAEDVASLIWFLIENRVKGQVIMPPLDWCSLEAMTRMVISALETNPVVSKLHDEIESYGSGNWEPIVTDYKCESSIAGWKPDCEDIEELVAKTARWYNANRWALNV